MARKENKGGRLTNEQVEQDNKVKGKADGQERSYIGAQDTGDSIVRRFGDDVQRREGLPEKKEDKDRQK